MRTSYPLLAVMAGLAMMVLSVSPASAGLVVEDFSYSSGILRDRTGGSGWGGPWGATTNTTSRVLVDASSNLTSTLYSVTQSGTGHANGNYNAFRGINRQVEPDLAGEVWFSVLLQNTASNHHAGIQFNVHTATQGSSAIDYNQGPWDIELSGTSLIARYNNSNSSSLATLALNETHLILGRLILGPGNDTMELWADPSDLCNLGSPLFSAGSADMGDDLYLAGIFAYGTMDQTSGLIDALRVSDGNGEPDIAFEDVTGQEVPEPLTLALMAMGAAAAGGYLRRRRAA
ncbi:MAG: PEP-CTERM motif protein [Planctomycetes bacterium ADurb.Bin126]|nr:MAG: PEP-CTERM motif protein [Planctomycetes bacterium ADurb.Bin126]